MKVLDYILYINHSFLLIVRKLNAEDIEGRSKSALAIIVYFICLLLFCITYGICILFKLASYSNPTIVVSVMVFYILSRYFIFKRYKNQYNTIIETIGKTKNYSKTKTVFYFLFFLFTPIFLFWIGLIMLREFIY